MSILLKGRLIVGSRSRSYVKLATARARVPMLPFYLTIGPIARHSGQEG